MREMIKDYETITTKDEFINNLNEANYVNVDTRDFYVNYYNITEDTTAKYSKILNAVKQTDYFMSASDIYDWLTKTKEASGDNVEWRFLSYDNYPEWLKYVRFIKADTDKWIPFEWSAPMMRNEKITVLKLGDLKPENIKTDVLGI